jgi:long-chain acyl-CoA synthetase
MDITPYTELKIAPRAVFDTLPERRSRVRFMVPIAGGDWRAVTWGAFAAQIRSIALFLAASGLGPRDRAAIFAPNRVEWISAALAIQAAGGVMVPVYAANTPEQAAYVVQHSDAKVVFVDTPALLSRVFEAWDAYAAVDRIVLSTTRSTPPSSWPSSARRARRCRPMPSPSASSTPGHAPSRSAPRWIGRSPGASSGRWPRSPSISRG